MSLKAEASAAMSGSPSAAPGERVLAPVTAEATGFNPGINLNASEPKREQLRPAHCSEFPLSTAVLVGLGAGRSQVQILSPR
jgi:hypothetical protein